jgi:Flp pilus assembly protein TadB
MKIVFFKRPKPKQFSYKPRYWDPEKEEFERRKRELDGIGKDERNDDEVRHDLRRNMETRWRRRHDPGSAGRSNPWMKLFIYALVIFLAVYFIFFTGIINNLVRFFTE